MNTLPMGAGRSKQRPYIVPAGQRVSKREVRRQIRSHCVQLKSAILT